MPAAVRAEAQATRREHLHWGAVGAGVTYCIYDSSWLQLPWWPRKEPPSTPSPKGTRSPSTR